MRMNAYFIMETITQYTIGTILVFCLVFSGISVYAEQNLSGSFVVTEIRNEAGALIQHSDISRISASFDGMNVSGSAGCNQYQAPIIEKDGAITISAPITTLLSCQPEVMEEESQFLKNLKQAVHYKLNEDTLLLFDAENHPIITLRKSEETGRIPFPYDTPFILTKILKDDKLTYAFLALKTMIEFHPDGTISGNGGCNNFSSTYNLTATEITFEPVRITKKACNKSRLNQEKALLDVLKGTIGYEVRNDQLIMTNDAGVVVAEWKKYIPQ